MYIEIGKRGAVGQYLTMNAMESPEGGNYLLLFFYYFNKTKLIIFASNLDGTR